MLFNSFHFLVFFPCSLLVYYLLPERQKPNWLLAASAYFYMAFIPWYLLILLALIAIDYSAGLLLARQPRRLWLVLSLLANLAFLSVFKYYDFFSDNLAWLGGLQPRHLGLILPLGLSFHTFQSMAYTIEVYRGTVPAERNLRNYALYVLFYPQLVAGPIERPMHLLPQIRSTHPFDPEGINAGARLMLWGLFKKIVIADRLAEYVNPVFAAPTEHSNLVLLIAVNFFAFQIYCDFSGYTDIARGAARALGYDLAINFNHPYLARSAQDFWRRWHISLSSWFRDYVYVPLGGNRCTPGRNGLNLVLTLALSGLWHGANWTFVIWGLYHGLLLLMSRVWTGFQRVPLYPLVLVGWVFFRAPSLTEAAYVLGHLWPTSWPGLAAVAVTSKSDLVLSFALIAFLMLIDLIEERTGRSVVELVTSWPGVLRWATYYATILTVLFLGRFSSQQFLYFQF